ncbi:Stk1 family PASTA domain-containing Ser/Thr kinase [uncultured Faecalibacterium sp.]|jgi:serine/threonine protein kinase|uniref:Stk1 family PASTA domain-containing Ser/Thr kinase n=1 Tax=uncultured Faecalibacterium sp. TaxID=259315 RepID=UPI0026DB565C|nr:Stk1 family PASTA domain-containing Ser/Thr kinase [uncultured Faecalibacterium sp.]
MDNLIGKKLDGLYEVKELIGSGGMANVYKAVMLGRNGPVPAGTVVAVKVLRQEYTHDPELVRRFKNESKAISLLNHPNIVKVYDVSVNDQLQYIVMEYVDGMTLREYLNERGGKLTSRETVHFISQILKALEHAHANGVVHRDIKPQNIMLLDNGQLRMMDFGIARISRAENQLLSGKTMGSVHYISPEQAKGDETDCTSDIYSVGVMMYEMLSGQLPFDAEDAVEVAIKQISDQPKSLHEIAPQVPAALVEITEKAMAKLPQNRYASAREMLDALDTYVQNPSVMFEYQYITEDAPEKVVKRTMNQNKAARQNHPNESAAPRGKKATRKRRTIFLPVLFGITIAFALACLALCWLILNDSSNLMNNKADITLNDYIGMTQEEAQATEQVASGQISVTWEQEYNSNYAAGYIYKQSPVSGRTVREGQGVTLTVSLGTQYVTVPDLTNYVQADAEQQLKSLGVSVLVTQAVDTSVASGAVIRTDPAAGTQVESGSTVVVYVSRPQVATTTKVPSLSGMSVDDARTLLVQNHLGLGSQTDQYSDQPVGTVIGQNPAAGSTAKLNGRVNITVSAGPEPAPVEPEAPSDSGSDWWGSLWGGDSSSSSGSSSSTETGESASNSEGSGLADWWTSLLG